MTDLVLALDLGGTKLRGALADRQGDVLAEQDVATDKGSASALARQIVGLRDSLCQAAGVPVAAITAVGLGVPAIVRDDGLLFGSQNLPGLEGWDATSDLGHRLRAPVRVANDGDAAGLAEGWRGGAVGVADYVVITIGTGVGMGIVSSGRLVRGAHGAAGEISSLPLGPHDPFDPELRARGSFETAVAGPALGMRVDAALASGRRTMLRTGARLEAIAEAAAGGDEVAAEILAAEARLVALGVAAVVAVLDPGLVVLSGGVGAAVGLVEPVRRLAAELLPRVPRIERGELGERGPLVGAIAIALGVEL